MLQIIGTNFSARLSGTVQIQQDMLNDGITIIGNLYSDEPTIVCVKQGILDAVSVQGVK